MIPGWGDHVSDDLEQTFLKLVRENDARLWKLCRVYARDPDAREDLHQEMLVQLWRSLPSFAGASLPGTGLYRVALNTALAQKWRLATGQDAKMMPAAWKVSLAPNVVGGAQLARLGVVVRALFNAGIVALAMAKFTRARLVAT